MISFRDFFFQIQINFEQNSFSSVYLEIFTYVAIMVRDTFHLTVLFKNRKIVDCSNKNRKLYEILIATVWTGILLFFLIIRYSNFKLFWFCWQYFFPIMFSHLSCLYSYNIRNNIPLQLFRADYHLFFNWISSVNDDIFWYFQYKSLTWNSWYCFPKH